MTHKGSHRISYRVPFQMTYRVPFRMTYMVLFQMTYWLPYVLSKRILYPLPDRTQPSLSAGSPGSYIPSGGLPSAPGRRNAPASEAAAPPAYLHTPLQISRREARRSCRSGHWTHPLPPMTYGRSGSSRGGSGQ